MVELNPEPKFHQKRSNGSKVMTGDGQTNGRTDMGQIIYLSFVKKDRSKMYLKTHKEYLE